MFGRIFKKQKPIQRRRLTDDSSDKNYIFSRNRTLTGSTSSGVNVRTGAGRNDLESDRMRMHQLVRMRRRIVMALAGVAVVAGCVIALLMHFTGSVRIVVTEPSGGYGVKAEQYRNAVQNYFNAHPLERLTFLRNDKALQASVVAAHPEVASVKGATTGTIATAVDYGIEMRRPVVSWDIDGKRLYVDATGILFETNYFNEDVLQLIDENNVVLHSGRAVASTRLLSFVGRLVSVFSKSGYTVERVVLPLGTTRQVEAYLKDYSAGIRLSIDRGVGEQAEDAKNAMMFLQGSGAATPEYIDVRVGGKAFYK